MIDSEKSQPKLGRLQDRSQHHLGKPFQLKEL